jgi:hypothetical protein
VGRAVGDVDEEWVARVLLDEADGAVSNQFGHVAVGGDWLILVEQIGLAIAGRVRVVTRCSRS